MSTIQSRLEAVNASNNAAATAAKTSNRYRVIDTPAVVARVVESLGLDASVESVHGKGWKSTKHAVVITLSTPIMLAGTACFPRIYVRNSYAGESALTVRVGFYRLICSNGMMVGQTHFSSSIRHVESGVAKLPQLTSGIQAAVKYLVEELPALADRLNRIILTPEQVEAILANSSASKRLADIIMSRVRTPVFHVRAEDKQTDGRSLSAWNVWNIINEVSRIGSRSQLRLLDRDAILFQAITDTIGAAA